MGIFTLSHPCVAVDLLSGIELAIRARVPNDTNFQVFKFKFHMASLQKKGTSAERLFAFPMFQEKNQCQNICRAFGAVLLSRKKGLVLSDFLLFQAFKINQLIF